MATPTHQTTTIGKLLAQARLELRLDDGTGDNLLLTRYIKQVVGDLALPMMFTRKEATLQVYEDKVNMPDDFVRFDQPGSVYISNITNSDGSTVAGSIVAFPVVGNNAFFTGDPSGLQPASWYPMYQIVDNVMYFQDNSGVNEIKIAYTAVKYGEDGTPIIPSAYERMIVSYAKWKYAQTFAREFSADIRGEYRSEYVGSKRYLKGRENLQTEEDRQLTTIIMNRMV